MNDPQLGGLTGPRSAQQSGTELTPARLRLEGVLLAVAFAVAHTQSPLYYSNQNQYLLHGAALAGHGHLEHDWLANTADPTPLFSLVVAGAYSLHEWLLQPMYFVQLMGYFLAARWLVAAVPGFPNSRGVRIAFAALFIAVHAAILRWASIQLTGVDYPWYFQAGLAAQYLLGPGIQPSAFGVLLLAAVAAFAHGRVVLACALAALACWLHSTYLLPAALLVGGFLTVLLIDRRGRTALVAGAVALAGAVPVIAYTLWRFDPFDPSGEHALHILARIRIPHHTVASRWFDWVAGLQLAWIALGLILIRREPVGRALAVAALGSAGVTALQLATESNSLALAFPWRLSVLLVPIATAVIIAKLLAWQPPGKWGERIALAVLLALVAGGVVVTAGGIGYRMVEEEQPLYDHIRATATPTDVYLIPTSLPNVSSGRGAVSNTFAPPPRAKEGTNQIPVDLQRFRLATGARIYVDFKSVPYAAPDVEEWYRRMQFATDFNTKHERHHWSDHVALKAEGITHVIAPVTKPLDARFLREEYRDGAYIVYRVE
jgi:hypothetical protein